MSDTYPGSNRTSPRQLITAVAKTPRRLLITGLTGLIALASAVTVVAAPAARAATATNPYCVVPAGVTWQKTSEGSYILDGRRLVFADWLTTYNGVQYNGLTEGFAGSGAATTPPSSTVTGALGFCAPVGQPLP